MSVHFPATNRIPTTDEADGLANGRRFLWAILPVKTRISVSRLAKKVSRLTMI
jgi:hypothetical protein